MAENVSTGGVMQFQYQKNNSPRLDPERRKEIGDAYEDYYERKERKERSKKILFVILGIIILLIIACFIYYSYTK